jgi:hypothetical protein
MRKAIQRLFGVVEIVGSEGVGKLQMRHSCSGSGTCRTGPAMQIGARAYMLVGEDATL